MFLAVRHYPGRDPVYHPCDLPLPFGRGDRICAERAHEFYSEASFQAGADRREKYLQKLARPVSMLLVLFGVIGVIALVMLVLVPQLGETFINLGRNIQRFIPKLQVWAAGVFHDNPDMIVWINDLKFDWNKIMDTGINFFTQGAGNVLNSTITAGKKYCQRTDHILHCIRIFIYILLQKGKTDQTV